MSRANVVVFLVAAWGVGCAESPPSSSGPTPGQSPAQAAAPAPERADTPPAERVLTEEEFALLKDDLEDLRAGVRPFDATAIGVCALDDKSCGRFIGLDAPDLPPGEYLLAAELRAPRLGPSEGWPVSVATECTFTGPSGSRTTSDQKTYTVRYAGEERGYRLRLRTIRSPNPGGAGACTYTLSVVGSGAAWSGSWSMPAAG